MVVVATILVGLILGSFLSVLIARWPTWHGVVAGRSHCPQCEHVLAWYELIPVVSWLLQQGRCRACGAGISGWYPTYELTMALVLGGYALRFGAGSWWAVTDLVVLAMLAALFFFDLRHFVLPDVLTLGLAALGLVRLIVLAPASVLDGVVAGVSIALVLGLLWRVSDGRWLGFGDVKLGLAIGLLFGFVGAGLVTIGAIWAGALVGVVLMLAGRATRKTALPFGAFWTVAAMIAILWPESITAASMFFSFR